MDNLMMRRRAMMTLFSVGGDPDDWQEYPVECWGYGNLYPAYTYNRWANLLYDHFPLLSQQMKIEGGQGYTPSITWWGANDEHLGAYDVSTGIITAPEGAAYFSLHLYDMPPMSEVDSGLFKIYYFGQPYQKPTPKPVMTGEDYLWAIGNGENGDYTSLWNNRIVRNYQPILSPLMDVDMTAVSTYQITMHIYDSSYNLLNGSGGTTFTNGYSYTNVLSSYPGAAYYRMIYWNAPSMQDAMSAPFRIIFRND